MNEYNVGFLYNQDILIGVLANNKQKFGYFISDDDIQDIIEIIIDKSDIYSSACKINEDIVKDTTSISKDDFLISINNYLPYSYKIKNIQKLTLDLEQLHLLLNEVTNEKIRKES